MESLQPWHSLARVDGIVRDAGEDEAREWLKEHWNREFLAAEPAVVRRLLPLVPLGSAKDRAATVLYAVDHDWVEVLDASDRECGFMPAFWRDAFKRAREASSVQCIAWLLANKGDAVATTQEDALEL